VDQIEQQRDAAETRMYEMMDLIMRLSRSLTAEDAPRQEAQRGIRIGPVAKGDK
jgi:hypothetical protein